MTEDKILELLSAYLDGESEDPEAVERLLEGEPAVRRRFEALKAQSASLRDLKLPEVGPAFATRVLAGVREERLKRHRGWMPLVLPLAAVAAVVVVLGAVYLATETPPQTSTPTFANDMQKWRTMDPEMLDAALFERLAADPQALDELDSAYDAAIIDEPLDVTELYTLDEIAEVMQDDAGLDELIEELNPDEKAAFRQLLIAYAMEG